MLLVGLEPTAASLQVKCATTAPKEQKREGVLSLPLPYDYDVIESLDRVLEDHIWTFKTILRSRNRTSDIGNSTLEYFSLQSHILPLNYAEMGGRTLHTTTIRRCVDDATYGARTLTLGIEPRLQESES